MGDALVQSGKRYEAATYCALHARVPRWGTVVVSLLSPYCAPFSRLCGVTHACAPLGHCPLCHWSFPSFALFAFGKKMGCTRECPRKKQAFSLVVPLVCCIFVANFKAMKRITQENFEAEYADSIELREMDKFICKEMGRQVHRYIKAMSGTLKNMEHFEASLTDLTVPEKEVAIARYIDRNRKVLSGLDFRIVVARAMANYCDTFSYLLQLLADNRRMEFYLDRLQSKYIRFHEVFEADGKFGIRSHDGTVLIPAEYDFLRTPYIYKDDLDVMPVIAEKEGKMGLVLPDGKNTVVAPFVYDNISLLDEYPYFEGTKDGETAVIRLD